MNRTSTSRKLQVFVSYAHEDKEWMQDIVAGLKTNNLDPVYDAEGIKYGDNWRARVKQMLDACPAMVVLFSTVSVSHPWVLYECIYGIATNKRVIFIAKNNVQIPDPISDIQGAFINEDDIIRTVQTIGDQLRSATELEQSASSMNAKAREVLIASIRRFIELTEKPDIEEFKRVLKDLLEPKVSRDTYIQIIEDEIAENGLRLAKHEVGTNVSLFQKLHRQQSILGELLSRLVENPLYFFRWTDPIVVDGKTLRVSKYVLTEGLYHLEFRMRATTGLDGSGGLPHIMHLDGMTRGSPLERSLVEDLAVLQTNAHKTLQGMGIQVKGVRLPTTREWLVLAQPPQPYRTWDYRLAAACNIKSNEVNTEPSVVGTFPAGGSRFDCHDVIGNLWDLCRDPDGTWYVMGFSYMNLAREVGSRWTTPIPIEGKGTGQPVGIRFVADV